MRKEFKLGGKWPQIKEIPGNGDVQSAMQENR